MSAAPSYQDLLARKRVAFEPRGLAKVPALNSSLFPHQAACTEFSLRAGCSAMFLDTGLGKSRAALEWGRVVVEATNKPVLMLAPLAVGPQHVREAAAIGVDAVYIREPSEISGPRIYITNYERLAKFDASMFAGIILDESSILKSFTGATTRKLIAAFSQTPFRLACTATPAPNDHMELGQHAQFLGIMPSNEMLSRWFVTDQTEMGRYRLKRPAVRPFWDWVASWARCASLPSDLGFGDDGFVLPPLRIEQHVVGVDQSTDAGVDKSGQAMLFRMPTLNATSLHKEKRLTLTARVERAAEIVLGELRCGRLSTQPNGGSRRASTQSIAINETARETGRTSPKGENTCGNTMPATASASQSSGARMRKRETPGAAPSMPPTPNSAKSDGQHHGQSAPKQSVQPGFAHSSESTLSSTNDCSISKVADVPSANPLPAVGEESAWPLITATDQALSGVSSAPTATKGSVSSPTIQIDCSEQSITSHLLDWWIVWCDTDYEQEELERVFGDLAISIKGSQSSDRKVELHEAWLRGDRKILITKPRLFGFGLNWQHCARQLFIGLSYSYEGFYQAVRRCWRFGQQREVIVHVVMAETETGIWDIVSRKAGDHEGMKTEMRGAMARATRTHRIFEDYQPTRRVALPSWLKEVA